ncbi:MAG TPA: hypothetical protein VED40_20620 [Azospirillaceae bacterium]|nr:hypothetical protein [Azospirillaceae bacterium]
MHAAVTASPAAMTDIDRALGLLDRVGAIPLFASRPALDRAAADLAEAARLLRGENARHGAD